jgi:tryptophan synthase alpha chain
MKLDEKFEALASEGRIAFMPYVCVGDPDAEYTVKIAETLVEAGADVLELGLPFSDPIADGPTIQKASQRALQAGMNTDKYFRVCRRISRLGEAALVSMTYYNLILQHGVKRFVRRCADSGISGIIVPDLPFEECDELEEACVREGVSLIQLVSLTTDERRLDGILKHARGFIYLVSVLGVTGARKHFSDKAPKLLQKLRRKTPLPVCLGFGISQRKHVEKAKKLGFSGVIVGSALIDVVERNIEDKKRALAELYSYARGLKEAT